jgi:acetyl/propionyl-CoA carboxylase alpha subunit
MPSPGLVREIRPAGGPGIRDDSGVLAGYTVPVFYDSMIAKLVAWAGTRGEAVARMTRALEEYEVLGIRTTIPFFLWLMREPDYVAGRFDTTYLDRLLEARRGESFSTFTEEEKPQIAIAAALDAWFRASGAYVGGGRRTGSSAWTVTARQEALRHR